MDNEQQRAEKISYEICPDFPERKADHLESKYHRISLDWEGYQE